MLGTDVQAEREAAFRALADLVENRLSEARSLRSAALKPLLVASGFDERQLGFQTFRAFLQAAEEAGFVSIRPASAGPDVDVLPLGAPEGAAAPSTSGRIRADIWDAFVDWNPGWSRLYDRERDRAFKIPANESMGESPAHNALRQEWKQAPERFAEITPISMQEAYSWMSEFLHSLPQEPARERLASTLASNFPFKHFRDEVRAVGLDHEWKKVQLERVRQKILDWASKHDIEIDLAYRPEVGAERVSPTRLTAGERFPGPRARIDESFTRTRILAAVNRMSTAELLRLPIPVEYLLEREGTGKSGS